MQLCIKLIHIVGSSATPPTYNAGNIDDGTLDALLLHVGARRLGHEEGSLQVHINHLHSQKCHIVRRRQNQNSAGGGGYPAYEFCSQLNQGG